MTQVGITVILLLTSKALVAGSLSEAESQFSEAQNKYFEALISSPNLNEEETKALREKILKPASQALYDTLRKENEAYGKKYLKIQTPEEFQKDREAAKKEDALLENHKDTEVSGLLEFTRKLNQPSEPTPLRQPAASSEVVIDGKDVPKLIEFKPKK